MESEVFYSGKHLVALLAGGMEPVAAVAFLEYLARFFAALDRAGKELRSLPSDVADEVRKLQQIVNAAGIHGGHISLGEGMRYYAASDLGPTCTRGLAAVASHAIPLRFPEAGLPSAPDKVTDAAGSTPPAAKTDKTEANGGGDSTPKPKPPPPPKRGRPVDTNPKADKRIYEAWKSGCHKTQANCDRELGLPAGGTYAACERHRKRLARKTRRTK